MFATLSTRLRRHRQPAPHSNAAAYDYSVSRDGRWWLIYVPTIDQYTQALRDSETAPMARDLIATWLDVPIESVRVNEISQ